MNEQTDIADILGVMANGPIIGAHRSKIDQLLQHFCGGGAHPRNVRGQAPPWSHGFDTQAVRLSPIAEIPRLLPAPHEAEEGQEGEARVSKFVTDIQARIAIINQMIPNAKTAERRALQRERSDLEEKLRKVSA